MRIMPVTSIHIHGPGNNLNNGWYFAPVYLPQGVIINNLRFYYFENSSVTGVAILQRTELGTRQLRRPGDLC